MFVLCPAPWLSTTQPFDLPLPAAAAAATIIDDNQEQLKFVYDTLEEFVVCGYTYFPVKDLTHYLKAKGQKDKQSGVKQNQYEREYTVSLWRVITSNMGGIFIELTSNLVNENNYTLQTSVMRMVTHIKLWCIVLIVLMSPF